MNNKLCNYIIIKPDWEPIIIPINFICLSCKREFPKIKKMSYWKLKYESMCIDCAIFAGILVPKKINTRLKFIEI